MKPPVETAEADGGSGDEDEDQSANQVSEPDPAEAVAEGGGDEDGEEDGDEDVDEDGDEDGDEDVDEDGAAERRRRPSRKRWIAAVVLVAVLAVAGYEGWLLFQHHQKDVAAAEALDAAEKFALTLTTIDPNAIDTNVADVVDGSTGEFKDLYQRSSGQLRQVLIDNEATANGMVIEAAVKSATKDRVEVILFIDQAVSNSTVPAPQLDRSRVVMTMEKVDGRWLASKVDLP
ncbi:MAG: Mce protein [Actinomycetia bacterium]|nr:Mce protein [Actinomycetes bacterium]MCH9702332.1 Mce protein [Actinomycetes bacterium]MCH9761270.1 Mce protein [Actinomycetes bacterium]